MAEPVFAKCGQCGYEYQVMYQLAGMTNLEHSESECYLNRLETLAVLASELPTPHYDNDAGDCYCCYCHCLLAGGPHSPNPHTENCAWDKLQQAITAAKQEGNH